MLTGLLNHMYSITFQYIRYYKDALFHDNRIGLNITPNTISKHSITVLGTVYGTGGYFMKKFKATQHQHIIILVLLAKNILFTLYPRRKRKACNPPKTSQQSIVVGRVFYILS